MSAGDGGQPSWKMEQQDPKAPLPMILLTALNQRELRVERHGITAIGIHRVTTKDNQGQPVNHSKVNQLLKTNTSSIKHRITNSYDSSPNW